MAMHGVHSRASLTTSPRPRCRWSCREEVESIHFYAIVPVSVTGVEGGLPSAGNDYIAVAVPDVQIAEPPTLIARDQGGVVSLRVEVAETRVPVSRVEIFRAAQRATRDHDGTCRSAGCRR